MRPAVAFVVGVVFAAGLGVSGMTDPKNVLAFLDIAGAWSPALMAVMVAAIGVHAVGLALAPPRPAVADAYHPPPSRPIDGRLLAGAAIFGVGWGLSGYCPGPAIVSLAAPSWGLVAFLAAVGVGMALVDRAPAPQRTTRESNLHAADVATEGRL